MLFTLYKNSFRCSYLRKYEHLKPVIITGISVSSVSFFDTYGLGVFFCFSNLRGQILGGGHHFICYEIDRELYKL